METLIYLLKVSACLSLFYGFYHFFLRKLTFFNVNRYYLLGTLVVSLLIPFVEFEIQSSSYQPVQSVEKAVFTTWVDNDPSVGGGDKQVDTKASGVVTANPVDWQKIVVITYWGVAAGMLLLFALQLLRVLWRARHVDQKIGKLKIIYKADGFTNCSFLDYVFVDQQNMTEEEIAQIIKHESVHVMCSHSVDKLIISIFKALLWFNPIIYFYDYALEQVHEFEADKRTSSAIGNTPYASLLLNIAVKKNNPVLVHSFVKHPLKERLQMLFAGESNNIKKWMYVAVLPLGMMLACTFGIQVVYAKMPEIIPAGVLDIAKQDNDVPEAAPPLKMLKAKIIVLETKTSDSLLMIDHYKIEDINELTIDGKIYDKGILYKISPRCLNSNETRFKDGKLMLKTDSNEIFYANEIDRYNKRAYNKSYAKETFYDRYSVKNKDGKREYDWIRIKTDGKSLSGGGVSIKRGSELLLIIDGKRYHESVLKTIGNDEYAKGWGVSFSTGHPEIPAKYGKKYDTTIEIYKYALSNPNAVSMPLSMSAKDSVVTSDIKEMVRLYGGATVKYQYTTIVADEIIYNTKEMTGVAKKANHSDSRSFDPEMRADSIHFDLKFLKFRSYGVKR
ncbi:MAG: M56 family metallopeptidase [Bacteroidota bacterium]